MRLTYSLISDGIKQNKELAVTENRTWIKPPVLYHWLTFLYLNVSFQMRPTIKLISLPCCGVSQWINEGHSSFQLCSRTFVYAWSIVPHQNFVVCNLCLTLNDVSFGEREKINPHESSWELNPGSYHWLTGRAWSGSKSAHNSQARGLSVFLSLSRLDMLCFDLQNKHGMI